MSRTCPTCQSARCGNHAACARRHAAYQEWHKKWIEAWEAIGVSAGIVIRVQKERPEATIREILTAYVQAERERAWMDTMATFFFGRRRA